jgi:hypothetical protein
VVGLAVGSAHQRTHASTGEYNGSVITYLHGSGKPSAHGRSQPAHGATSYSTSTSNESETASRKFTKKSHVGTVPTPRVAYRYRNLGAMLPVHVLQTHRPTPMHTACHAGHHKSALLCLAGSA